MEEKKLMGKLVPVVYNANTQSWQEQDPNWRDKEDVNFHDVFKVNPALYEKQPIKHKDP